MLIKEYVSKSYNFFLKRTWASISFECIDLRFIFKGVWVGIDNNKVRSKNMIIRYIEIPYGYWTCSHNVVYSSKK